MSIHKHCRGCAVFEVMARTYKSMKLTVRVQVNPFVGSLKGGILGFCV